MDVMTGVYDSVSLVSLPAQGARLWFREQRQLAKALMMAGQLVAIVHGLRIGSPVMTLTNPSEQP